jgi:hypothetical protein
VTTDTSNSSTAPPSALRNNSVVHRGGAQTRGDGIEAKMLQKRKGTAKEDGEQPSQQASVKAAPHLHPNVARM